MTAACPISLKSIDANEVRIVSFLVMVLSVLFALLQTSVWIGALLLFDFTMRYFRIRRLSPFSLLAERVLSQWDVDAKPTDERPKRFAMLLGFGMVAFMTVAASIGWSKLSVLVAIVLSICALFEVLFDFCIGCKLYYLIRLLKVMENDRNID